MCSSVGQGLQLCPGEVESCFLRLKLAPPKTELYNAETNTAIITNNKNNSNDCELIANRNAEMGGWSFLQSLSDTKAPADSDNFYVHPLVKRSAFRLSEKSLEMCTERLGSETGSEGSDGISLLSLETRTVACDFIPSKPRESSWTRKPSRSNSFPPPLRSISGSNVQVKSYRENSRLVLQAVSSPPCHSYFHAERSEGRLRLSLFTEATPVLDNEDRDHEDGEEEVEVEEEEGNKGNDGGEIGTGKLQRPSSCKESGRNRGHKGGLLNWKPFLLSA